jgi:hypothetical protein
MSEVDRYVEVIGGRNGRALYLKQGLRRIRQVPLYPEMECTRNSRGEERKREG